MDYTLLIQQIAHFLIGFYFLFFGIWNIYHWRPTLSLLNQKNLPHPWLLLPLAIAWQSIAGIMIICGIFIKLAALSLIPFTLISICIIHQFWKHTGELRNLNLIIFVANLTVTCASLLLLLNNSTALTQL
ncbi:MAG: hypothetical protein A3E83_05250 [Gammaproteobacteria bacterium RIFCSPHIGHO2_12_FULL_41_20]|nr:MAG: hypothetical protein A3E83_05250 [Gammaproteobacteria bacterium RIFCSPHIGHO2_12_FULL_41_20]